MTQCGNLEMNMEKRRRLGIFYTPEELAYKMAEWAIQTPKATVLDPSFGGCAFLRAAVHRLRDLSAIRPVRQVFGADRDLKARKWLDSILSQGAREDQFYDGDFLSIKPTHFRTSFTAILGNPPYIKHHALSDRLQRVAVRTLELNGQRLSAMASYWAYFVLHSINFIAPGGRLALVLPGSLVHAEYAQDVRIALRNSFGKVTAIMLAERLFADAQEESVLVLAEGRAEIGSEIRVGLASWKSLTLDTKHLDGMSRVLTDPEQHDSWIRALLDSRILHVYDQVAAHSSRLGDLASIRIGIVTGANRFFVLKPSTLKSLSIARRHTTPILSHASSVKGLRFDQTALNMLKTSDATCLLLQSPMPGDMPPGIRRYLRKGVNERLHDRVKCAIRKPWHRVKAGQKPDAFLTYMCGIAPRLALNEARISCTNAIHSVTWREFVSERNAKAIVLGSLSTLTQFSAEIVGRSYGGGVLKLEPSEACRLIIPEIPDVFAAKLFSEVHHLCLEGKYSSATELVDEVLLGKLLTRGELMKLRLGLNLLRARRLRRPLFSSEESNLQPVFRAS